MLHFHFLLPFIGTPTQYSWMSDSAFFNLAAKLIRFRRRNKQIIIKSRLNIANWQKTLRKIANQKDLQHI